MNVGTGRISPLTVFLEDLPSDLPERLRAVLQPIAEANASKRLLIECSHPDRPQSAWGACSTCHHRWWREQQRARSSSG